MSQKLDIPLCLDPADSLLRINKAKTAMLCLSCKPGPKCGVRAEQGARTASVYTEDNRKAQSEYEVAMGQCWGTWWGVVITWL